MDGLLKQIQSAKDAGASVILGGGRVNRPGFYVEATILTDISPANPVYKQELFGPVASLYVVETEDEAVTLANATPFGLGGSVFTADLEHGRQIAAQIESGMVFINHPTWTAPELPFGGIKNSGYGRELSDLGFGEFVKPPPGQRLARGCAAARRGPRRLIRNRQGTRHANSKRSLFRRRATTQPHDHLRQPGFDRGRLAQEFPG